MLARRRMGQAASALTCLACALTSLGCGRDTGDETARQCELRYQAYCDRYHVCAPTDFAKLFRSPDDCVWDLSSGHEACSPDKYVCPPDRYQVLDPACPGEIATQPCVDFEGDASHYVLPPDCSSVCP